MSKTDLPPCNCPHCDHRIDAATGIDDDKPPRVGDFSICINCATVLVFREGMRPAKASVEDLGGLPVGALMLLWEARVLAMRIKKLGASFNAPAHEKRH
jgi:hypothetical protein